MRSGGAPKLAACAVLAASVLAGAFFFFLSGDGFRPRPDFAMIVPPLKTDVGQPNGFGMGLPPRRSNDCFDMVALRGAGHARASDLCGELSLGGADEA